MIRVLLFNVVGLPVHVDRCPFGPVSYDPVGNQFEDRLQDELDGPWTRRSRIVGIGKYADLPRLIWNFLLPCPQGPIRFVSSSSLICLRNPPPPLSSMVSNVTRYSVLAERRSRSANGGRGRQAASLTRAGGLAGFRRRRLSPCGPYIRPTFVEEMFAIHRRWNSLSGARTRNSALLLRCSSANHLRSTRHLVVLCRVRCVSNRLRHSLDPGADLPRRAVFPSLNCGVHAGAGGALAVLAPLPFSFRRASSCSQLRLPHGSGVLRPQLSQVRSGLTTDSVKDAVVRATPGPVLRAAVIERGVVSSWF